MINNNNNYNNLSEELQYQLSIVLHQSVAVMETTLYIYIYIYIISVKGAIDWKTVFTLA